MSIDTIRQFIKDEAVRFGAKTDSPYNKSFIERNNTGKEALQDVKPALESVVNRILGAVPQVSHNIYWISNGAY